MGVFRLVPANAGCTPGAKKTGKALGAGALGWIAKPYLGGGYTEVAIFCEAGDNPYKWCEEIVRFVKNTLPKIKASDRARIAINHAPVRTASFPFDELAPGTPCVHKLISLKGGERDDVLAVIGRLLDEPSQHNAELAFIRPGRSVTVHGACPDDPFAALTVTRTAEGLVRTRGAQMHWLEGEDGLIGSAVGRAHAGLHSLVVIEDTDALPMLVINVAPAIFGATDQSNLGRIFWSKLSTRSKVHSYVDVNDVVMHIVNSQPLQEWIECGDTCVEAQVRRGVTFAAAALLAGGDTTSKLAGTAVAAAINWYMEYLEFIGPLVDRLPSADGLLHLRDQRRRPPPLLGCDGHTAPKALLATQDTGLQAEGADG